MSERTAIEWCDSTFNPWIGCTRVSPACDDCYAARSTPARAMGIAWGSGEPRRRTAAATWKLPQRWEREHAEFFAQHGRRRRVFCASLADVFDNEVPAEWRVDLFRLIVATPSLDWLLLTKRIGNVRKMAAAAGGWPRNAALGFTAVNQPEIERDWSKAQDCKSDLRPLFLFVSIEPMLGPIRLDRVMRSSPDSDWTYCDNALTGFNAHKCGGWDGAALDWVIAGGESGPKARPSHPDWFRSLRDQCAAAGVPFLFKQWGEWASVSAVGGGKEHHYFPGGATVRLVGKKAAGRLLDGVTHDGFPEV